MWIIKKTEKEQDLLNKAIIKAMKGDNKKHTEGSAVTIALKEYVRG